MVKYRMPLRKTTEKLSQAQLSIESQVFTFYLLTVFRKSANFLSQYGKKN